MENKLVLSYYLVKQNHERPQQCLRPIIPIHKKGLQPFTAAVRTWNCQKPQVLIGKKYHWKHQCWESLFSKFRRTSWSRTGTSSSKKKSEFKKKKNNRTERELSFKGRKYLQTKQGQYWTNPRTLRQPGDSANLLSDESVMNNWDCATGHFIKRFLITHDADLWTLDWGSKTFQSKVHSFEFS